MFIDGWDAFILDNRFTGNRNGGIMGKCGRSITCSGNRVEWNRLGGFILPNGDSYNITGNFFERSFGPALELGGEHTAVHTVTVTGNIFRRSGTFKEKEPLPSPDRSSHIKMQNCSGTVASGNSMRVGRNDGGKGYLSPNYSFIITDCRERVIKDNTMTNDALIENTVVCGDSSICLITDTPGCVSPNL